MKKTVIGLTFFIFIGLISFVTIRYYSFVFSKKISGVLVDVQHVGATTAILGADPGSNRRSNNKDIFSFAVGILDKEGNIHTASSEDRQWAVAQIGQCAEAKYFPYPPWELAKAGTYFNARLLHLRECPEGKKYRRMAPHPHPSELDAPAEENPVAQ